MAPKKSSKNGTHAEKSRKRSMPEKLHEKSPPHKKARTEASTSSAEQSAQSAKDFNLKLSSWNVNGLRAWQQKHGMDFLHNENPDVLCFQETKCSEDSLPDGVKTVTGYHGYWCTAEKSGYSGVGLLSKVKPINVTFGIDVEEHDKEGRVITAEYENFYLVTAYVPNSGRMLDRLDYRMKWDQDFFTYLRNLKDTKPVILCGDLNVAHQEIDIANPSSNRRNAGFTKEERDSFSSLLADGFIDSFRHLYPDTKNVYSFWTYMRSARQNNVGWRLDYFLCSEGLVGNIRDSLIHTEVMGSDHCPVSVLLQL